VQTHKTALASESCAVKIILLHAATTVHVA